MAKKVLVVGMVYGSAMDAGDITSNEKLMQEAFELGKTLLLRQS
jgi:hypothetical protein